MKTAKTKKSNFVLHFLEKENDLNKILRDRESRTDKSYLLFTSLWDEPSRILVNKLKDKYHDMEEGIPVYVLESFSMPHSFVIFNTTKLPHLVELNRNKVFSWDYLPTVYARLGI